jgi:hypothetical protein
MPFPFLPAGALLAASVLLGALVAFGLILRAMDRAIVGLHDNMLSGLVSGIRTWGSAGRDGLVITSPGATSGSPWGGSESNPTAEATPSPEVIDLGSRPIEPQPDNKL